MVAVDRDSVVNDNLEDGSMRLRSLILFGAFVALPSIVNAQAQTQPVPPASNVVNIQDYRPAATPQAQVPTNKWRNIIGMAVEQSCLRNGRTRAICIAAGAAAGGVGLQRAFDLGWADARQILGTSAATAASTAAVSCLGGAAVGAWFGGVGAIPGCAAGLLQATIGGAVFGAAIGVYNVTQDGTVQGNGVQPLSGSAVAPVTATNIAAQQAIVHQGLPINGSGVYGLGNQARTLIESNQAQLNTVIPCRSNASATQYYACIIITATPMQSAGNPDLQRCDTATGLPVINGCRGGTWSANPASMRIAASGSSGTTPPTLAQMGASNTNQLFSSVNGDQVSGLALGTVGYTMYRSNVTYASASAVPAIKYIPTVSAMPALSGFASGIPPEALSRDLDQALVARMANAAHLAAGSAAGEYQHTTANAVTAQDIAAVVATRPDLQPQLIDLYRPIPANNTAGGTSAAPVPEPIQIYNPAAAPQTATAAPNAIQRTREEADTDLELGMPVLGNPMEPLLDFIAGPFAPFLDPIIGAPPTTACPVWSINHGSYLAPMVGVLGGSTTADSQQAFDIAVADTQAICDWAEQYRTIIQSVIGMMLVFLAFYWYFE